MKSKILYLALLLGLSLPLFSQSANNEDEVIYKTHQALPYVENEVLVMYKSESTVQVPTRKNSRRMLTTQVSEIDALYKTLGVTEVKPLMPLTGHMVAQTPRKLNGKMLPKDQNLSKLVCIKYQSSQLTPEEVAAQFNKLSYVEMAEPNYVVYAQSIGGGDEDIPTADSAIYTKEPLFSQQWGLSAINLPFLWNQPKKTSKRPVIAILDTGVDIEHPDLAANIWTNEAEAKGISGQDDDANGYYDDIHGYDFVNDSYTMQDLNGHGTHCAGIAAAVGNNGIGITGANPDAYIMPLQVLDKKGMGDIGTIVQGLDYAIANGADLLSMSYGGCNFSKIEYFACLKAYNNNLTLVAACGNNSADIYQNECNPPGLVYPASFSFVIGVEAMSNNGLRAGFSNYDPDGPIYTEYSLDDFHNYEVAAPGTDILSTYPGGKYKQMNGTSMACPMVAGAISRLLQTREYSSQEMLTAALITSRPNSLRGNINMQHAYNLNEFNVKPVLAVYSSTIVDTICGGDGDGQADAGETVEIYPVVKDIYGMADSIYLRMEVVDISDTSLVHILDSVIPLGIPLSSGAIYYCPNSIRVHISQQCGNLYPLKLRYVVECRNGSPYSFSQVISIKVQNIKELPYIIKKDFVIHDEEHYVMTRDCYLVDSAKLIMEPGSSLEGKVYESSISNFGTKIICNRGSSVIAKGKPGKMITITNYEGGLTGDIEYVLFPYLGRSTANTASYTLTNCIVQRGWATGSFTRCNIGGHPYLYAEYYTGKQRSYTACNLGIMTEDLLSIGTDSTYTLLIGEDSEYRTFPKQYVNILVKPDYLFVQERYWADTVAADSSTYLGTDNESYLRSKTRDVTSYYGLRYADLSTRAHKPFSEAHGCVWKVLIDGFDAQDQFKEMPILSVGEHKCEVYFNRPMNVAVSPEISFGVRMPFTQNKISDNGSWSEDSTRYTAYFTIDAKTLSDGLNTINIRGAQDDEYFDIPLEFLRFKMVIAAVGSLSTGLMADAGLGKITLTWVTDEEDFEDLMGYNIYRWTNDTIWDSKKKVYHFDTIQINETLIDSQDTLFVDYNVVPGTPYYYVIRQMTTSLENYDMSNPVVAIPLTAMLGDANGSMTIDVADVITEVNYISNLNPQPFIFEAADVNIDSTINILDVVGTVNIILNPKVQSQSINNLHAYYYIENGILYVESDVVLGGVQFTFDADSASTAITKLDALNGFEVVTDWRSNSEYFFMAYSIAGKTISVGKNALLQIGNAEISSIVLSDTQGHNVRAIPGVSTKLDGTYFIPGDKKVIENNTIYIIHKGKKYSVLGELVQ